MSEVKKFRKKPVVIDAVQWTGANNDEVCAFGGEAICQGPQTATLGINTLEGMMTAQPYDYIIKGIKGEFYPCKPDIFEATYEAVLD